LLITLDYDQSQMNGPPFSVPDADVHSLLAPAWAVEIIEHPDVLDQEWKFLKGGVTRLVERVYRLSKIA
ncbi:MAG: thiopurine S-methyltransferase, partial [Pseudomonas sp.]|nr:thiopurine S-methyltransferase [Pseudomonas sp.]